MDVSIGLPIRSWEKGHQLVVCIALACPVVMWCASLCKLRSIRPKGSGTVLISGGSFSRVTEGSNATTSTARGLLPVPSPTSCSITGQPASAHLTYTDASAGSDPDMTPKIRSGLNPETRVKTKLCLRLSHLPSSYTSGYPSSVMVDGPHHKPSSSINSQTPAYRNPIEQSVASRAVSDPWPNTLVASPTAFNPASSRIG